MMVPAGHSEEGITPTVRTIFSSYLLKDILDEISTRKCRAALNWLDFQEKKPESCLIIGAYLTGAHLANLLGKVTKVTVFDKNPYLHRLVDPSIPFTADITDLAGEQWQVIIDTTGLGGIDPDFLASLPVPESLLVEDPCSEGSDIDILRHNQCFSLLSRFDSPRKGSLFTGGIQTKTSGTMTLMTEVIRRSMEDAKLKPGVLYSTSNLEHFERLLFREKDYPGYLRSLDRPALIVSSLLDMDCDQVIKTHLLCVKSRINTFPEEL